MTPTSELRWEEIDAARAVAHLRMCEKEGNAVPCASCHNSRGYNQDVGCITLAIAILSSHPAPAAEETERERLRNEVGEAQQVRIHGPMGRDRYLKGQEISWICDALLHQRLPSVGVGKREVEK